MNSDSQTWVGSEKGRPRLLVVPHVYAENISVREIEFARRLTRHFEVYCLAWDDAIHIDCESSLERKWKQFRTALGSAMAPQKPRYVRDGVTFVSAPVLQPILLQRLTGAALAVTLCQFFNRRTLESLSDRLHITHILLAAGTFALPRRPGVRVFFDVVDWVPEDRFPPDLVESKRRELKVVARGAQDVFAVSEPLCEKLRRDCEIVCIPIPNGADTRALRAVSPTKVAELRNDLGLHGRFVIGYIGNHGSYTGVDFVVDVFRRVRQCIPDSALLIVGPADYWRSLLDSSRAEGVVWTGPVPPSEVGKYFNLLDVGILAQERNFGTELAFQIKVVEYSACHKFVVSTPLRTWELLNWPNVFLAELRVETWVKAIVKARQSKWKPEWDEQVDSFDWNTLADRMATIMLGSGVIESKRCAS